MLSLIKTFYSWKILTPLLVMLAYSGISIWILTNVGVWNVSLLKDTIFWLLGTAVVLLFNTNKASQNPAFFKTMMLETIALTVLIEFLANLYSLSFIAEFIIMPFVFFIAGMSALADSRDEYKVARKPLKLILAGYGLFVLLFSVSLAICNFTGLFSIHNLLVLVVPSVLTVMYLPFIYVFALIMAYETLFVRIDSLLRDNRELAGFTKMKIFALCYFDLRLLSQFSQNTGAENIQVKR